MVLVVLGFILVLCTPLVHDSTYCGCAVMLWQSTVIVRHARFDFHSCFRETPKEGMADVAFLPPVFVMSCLNHGPFRLLPKLNNSRMLLFVCATYTVASSVTLCTLCSLTGTIRWYPLCSTGVGPCRNVKEEPF